MALKSIASASRRRDDVATRVYMTGRRRRHHHDQQDGIAKAPKLWLRLFEQCDLPYRSCQTNGLTARERPAAPDSERGLGAGHASEIHRVLWSGENPLVSNLQLNRQRRVKCDEAKPFCRRCVDGGHTCTGYPEIEPPRRQRDERSVSRASSVDPKLSPSPFASQSLDTRIQWSSAESRSIKYALTQLIPGLVGEYGCKFWGQHVVQMAYQDAAVKHALAALGAVYETRSLAAGPSTRTSSHAEEQAIARRFALQQYNESIRHLREKMELVDLGSSRIALICSLVFVTVELLQRNNDQALKHLQAGIRIYRSRFPADASSSAVELLETSEDGIGELFYRLDSQATDYMHFRHPQIVPETSRSFRSAQSPRRLSRNPSLSPVPAPSETTPVPESGRSAAPSPLATLRARFEDLHKQCLVFLQENKMYERLPRRRVPEVIQAQHRSLLRALESLGRSLEEHIWQISFPSSESYSTSPSSLSVSASSTQQLRGAQKLIVAQKNLTVMTRAQHVDGPWEALDTEYAGVLDVVEVCLPYVSNIVSSTAANAGENTILSVSANTAISANSSLPHPASAKGKLQASASSATSGTLRPTRQSSTTPSPYPFTLDSALLFPLYHVSRSAPSSQTRQRAASMLRRINLQEGLWSSDVAADIAESCLEDDIGRLSPCVPENVPQLACRFGVDERGGLRGVEITGMAASTAGSGIGTGGGG